MFSYTFRYRLLKEEVHPLLEHTIQTSPGKSDNLHLVYLPDLLYGACVVLDFVLLCKLVRPKSASYLVLVHQTEILPPASFRFHVAVDTLAFG